jgi:hypothetical protein
MNKIYKSNKYNEYGWLINKILIILFMLYSYLYFIKKKIAIKISDFSYDIIIPISQRDIKSFIQHKFFYEKYINYSNIVIIGSNKTEELLKKETSIIFINENELVEKKNINKFLNETKFITTIKDGWYEQQFLKMAYARICQKKYYLVWDADTIPIKSFKMFKNNKPIFDMKTEHHIPYFNTMKKLIFGLKFANRSYISEHMMIKTEFMIDLLDTIEKNDKLTGTFFWEKILTAIDINNISNSGFSEYETYGSFVDTKYPNYYIHRNWSSRRDLGYYFMNSNNLTKNDISWLSLDYYALSFEKWANFNKNNYKIIKNKSLRKFMRPIQLFNKYKKKFIKNQ